MPVMFRTCRVECAGESCCAMLRKVERLELADVVTQVREAVGRAGFPDRAAWLVAQERDLRSKDLGRQQAAIQQLHAVVLGMGGLHDIYYGSGQEQARVGRLIDLMWEATLLMSGRALSAFGC